ncbi:hypothetical protein AbraIFM66950_005746 [Aspergillus brasiliensis]|nr:hypothetical protein AbraIFM66950_005746 [Aspergillus brasiliensis]
MGDFFNASGERPYPLRRHIRNPNCSQGQTVGILLAGPIMETRGRKVIILMAAVTYTIGSLLMAVNFGSLAELLVGRIVSGLGSGMAYSAGPCYLSEIAPAELRGMLSTFYNAGIMSSVAGAYWTNFASSQILTDKFQWIVPMVLQMIPSTVLILGYPFVPESPRFLAMRGQWEAAHQSLSRIRGGLDDSHEYFANEWSDLSRHVQYQAEENIFRASAVLFQRVWTEKPVRKILIFVLIIQTFFITSGGNSITYYAPNILKSVGFDSERVLLFTAVYGLIKFLSVFIYAMFLIERFGRRPLLLIGATINLVCLIYLSAYLGKANITTAPEHASPAAVIAVVSLCVFAVGYGMGWGPSFSVAASEICPTAIRGPVVTLAFVYQNILSFGITRGFPNMTEAMHAYGPFALFSACTFCGIIWVFFSFPECRGRSMESTESLFMLPWYKTGFAPVENQSVNPLPDDEKERTHEHKEDIASNSDVLIVDTNTRLFHFS